MKNSDDIKKIREFIQTCHFFTDITPESYAVLEEHFEMITLLDGEILFHQGDVPDYFYVLTDGKLSTFLTKTNGQKILVGNILPAEPAGELGSLAIKPYSMTIIANGDSILMRISSNVFREVCSKDPTILTKMSKNIIDRSLKTLKFMTYESVSTNISLMFVNDAKYAKAFKDKLFSLHDPELLLVLTDTIKIEEIETKVNDAVEKQINLVFFMETWNDTFFNMLKKWLTHFYIIVSEEEKSFTNISKTIFFDLKQIPSIRNELVILHTTGKRIINTRKWLEKADFILHHHLRLSETKDFDRLVRFMTGKAVVLVLGGGGAKGLSHLGVIKGILDKNLPIDAIGGTSIGAAVAACYALNLSYDQALSFITKLKTSSVKSLRFHNIVWPIISLFSSNPATSLLIHLMDNALIEDLPIPYFAMASDVKNKKAIPIRQGLIWEGVRSSVSVPGVFPPVAYDGNLYVDGGLLNNLPVDYMRDMIGRGNVVIASSLSRREGEKFQYAFPPMLSLKKTIFYKLGFGKNEYLFPPFLETFIECLLLGSSEREDYNTRITDILIRPNYKAFKTLSFQSADDEEKLIKLGYEESVKAINRYYKGKIYKETDDE